MEIPKNNFGLGVINLETYFTKNKLNPVWKDKHDEIINRTYKVFMVYETEINGRIETDYLVDYVFPDGSSLISTQYIKIKES